MPRIFAELRQGSAKSRSQYRASRAVVTAAGILLLCSCAPATRPPVFKPLENVPVAGLPTGMAGWPEQQWWKQYGDAQLDRLIDMAMRFAPDLEVAQARYRSAQRTVDAQRAERNPQATGIVEGTYGYTHINAPPPMPGGGSSQGIMLQDSANRNETGIVGARLTWDLDLFGKQKAAIAEAVGQARASEASRAAAATMLQYNLANTYFDWQAQQARLALARKSERTAAQYSHLVELRVEGGVENPDSLDTANQQLAQQRSTVAQLEGSGALDIAQLAALVGVSPAQIGDLTPAPLPAVGAQLPADARLGLIARRPDIVASRWQIEASLRSIDQSRAAFYPDVSLMALGGFLRAYPNLGSGTRTDVTVGNFGPSITLPIFSGGRNTANFESSQAQLDTAVASYNQTVVQAAQDVATNVLTLQQLDAMKVQQLQQLASVSSQFNSSLRRRAQGVIDDRPYLNAQLQVDQQRDALLQLQAQMLATNLSLIHALGGGYRAADVPQLPQASTQDIAR